MRTIAPCATGIHQIAVLANRNGGGKFAHNSCGGGNFRDAFAFHPQTNQQSGYLGGGKLSRHNLAHQMQHFVVKQFVIVNQAV